MTSRYEIKMLLDSDQGLEEFMTYAHRTLFEMDLDPVSFHITDVTGGHPDDEDEEENLEEKWLEEPVEKPELGVSHTAAAGLPFTNFVIVSGAPEGLGDYENIEALVASLKDDRLG